MSDILSAHLKLELMKKTTSEVSFFKERKVYQSADLLS